MFKKIWPFRFQLAFLTIVLFGGGFYLFTGSSSYSVEQNIRAQIMKMPLRFEENRGQSDESVKYLARGLNHLVFFTPSEIVFTLKPSQKNLCYALKMKFLNANPQPSIKAFEEQLCKSNYFKGNDQTKWQTDIPNFSKIAYENLYSGIDAIFYGNAQQLEYDLVLAPRTNLNDVQLQFAGLDRLSIDPKGDLRITIDEQDIVMQKPFVYQTQDDKKIVIESNFVLLAQNTVGFFVGKYDDTKTLIIDPVVLDYSTYLGGSDATSLLGIAVDSTGSAYITGETLSPNFPTAGTPFQPAIGSGGGNADAVVTKFTPAGTSLVYSTYLGGTATDSGQAIIVDGSGNAYITGSTESTDFPTTAGAFQSSSGGSVDAFVTQFSPTGSTLVYSTYLGGADEDRGFGIAIDGTGAAYVTGRTASIDFPTTTGAFQTSLATAPDAFVTKLAPTGTTLDFSTYLGGNALDSGQDIEVDAGGNSYVVGLTQSGDFPTTVGAFQTALSGVQDAFITKLSPTGAATVYSTYLGGTATESGLGIALDGAGVAYVTGSTQSGDFPVVNPYQATLLGTQDAFVTALDAAGATLVSSTYLGGAGAGGTSTGSDIALDSDGNIFVTGNTNSDTFPVLNQFQTYQGNTDAFVTKFNPTASALVYSTYLGGSGFDSGEGIAVDTAGDPYITGGTGSSLNFPTANAFQGTFPAGAMTTGFVTKLTFVPAPPPSDLVFPPTQLNGTHRCNRFLTQTELFNIVTFAPPTEGLPPVEYRIYRDAALTRLIATIPASGPFIFTDHNRRKKAYTYFIVSVDQFGAVSTAASVTVEATRCRR